MRNLVKTNIKKKVKLCGIYRFLAQLHPPRDNPNIAKTMQIDFMKSNQMELISLRE